MYRRLPRGLAALTIEMARNADLGATRAPLLNLSKLGQRPSTPRVSPLTNLSVFLKNLQLVAAKVSKPKFRENSGNSLDFSKVLFQSGMSWFESSKVSQAIVRFPKLPIRPVNRPEIRAFCVSDSVSVLLLQRSQGGNRRKSPALSRNIPVLRRLSAETGLMTTAARRSARN